MFGFGSKKSATPSDRTKLVGLDLTASRARAVALALGRTRPLLLEDPEEDLRLSIDLSKHHTAVGRSGSNNSRRLPHLVCSNFLPQLGHSHEWQAGRHVFSPEDALRRVFDELRDPIAAETDAVGLAVPAYLSATQVKSAARLAKEAKLPLRGTASTPLAVAAHRVDWLLDPSSDTRKPEWVVPLRTGAAGPISVIIVDVDEFALHATLVGLEPNEVQQFGTAVWPKASFKLWKDRLLDAISDRCVRVCRRDPRDSADAEQALYDQLDKALDNIRVGQPAALTVRSEHWYQDLSHRPEEFDAFCGPLSKIAAEGVLELLRSSNLTVLPRAVWLTDAAARLPGLAMSIHRALPEPTEVLALSIDAVADAVAALVPLWLRNELPRGHLDTSIPIPPVSREAKPSGDAHRSASPRG